MKSLLLLTATCLLVFGCSTDYNKEANEDIKCINGHLLYVSTVHSYSGKTSSIYTPVFDARTNVPTLISCPDVEDGALLVKGD